LALFNSNEKGAFFTISLVGLLTGIEKEGGFFDEAKIFYYGPQKDKKGLSLAGMNSSIKATWFYNQES